ncbi:MAG: GNAT family N-acetyltransferase [Sedimentisphaerales bacterium]|nr:GNAT family N-acetyltransferase [Sedimentisphaerales bacterium]
MTKDDLGLGVRLTQEAGWNHLESDWLRFYNLGSEGSFVAEFEGRAVGTTMTFISDRIAWIAMVLVEKKSRGKGVGTALLKHALDYLETPEIETVRLDATHLGRPLYEKLGFMPEYEVVRFKGIAPQLGGNLKALCCGDSG